jgi:hypothetical protein
MIMSEDEFRPKKINDETVSLSGYLIPIKQIGCYLDPDSIIDYWQKLERENFPLVHTSSLLVALEFIHWTKKDMVSLLPFPMHIIRMVDAIHCAEFIEGATQRMNKLRERLSSLITKSIKFPDKQPITSNKILETVTTVTDEFRIAYALHRLNSMLKFNNQKDQKAPDFDLNGININIKIESKICRRSWS